MQTQIVLDRNYNGIRRSTDKYDPVQSRGPGSIRRLYDLTPSADPLEQHLLQRGPRRAAALELDPRLDALKGCHPDDLATPEDESCQKAEGP